MPVSAIPPKSVTHPAEASWKESLASRPAETKAARFSLVRCLNYGIGLQVCTTFDYILPFRWVHIRPSPNDADLRGRTLRRPDLIELRVLCAVVLLFPEYSKESQSMLLRFFSCRHNIFPISL